MVTGKCLVLKRRFISCLVKFIKNPGKKTEGLYEHKDMGKACNFLSLRHSIATTKKKPQ